MSAKNIFKNTAIVVVSVIVMLLILELVFRILYPSGVYKTPSIQNERVFSDSSYLQWVLKPNSSDTRQSPYGDYNITLQINSYGLRDYERPIYEGARKVLVLGDSMTYGQGVEINETYPKYLEVMLNKAFGNFEVFNGGYAGSHSIDSYYLYLKKEALQKFSPEIVVIGFFVYDDITDITLNEWIETEDGLPERIVSKAYDIEEGRLVRKRGILFKYKIARDIYGYLLYKSRLFSYIKNTISDMIVSSPKNRIFDINLNSELSILWEKDKKILNATNDLVKSRNATLIIAVMPVKFQIYDDMWEDYSSKIGKDKLIRKNPNNLLENFGKESGVMVVDIYDLFYEKNKKTPLFLKVDGHLNSNGHELMAEEIHKKIKQIQNEKNKVKKAEHTG